jgi:hypothetical protein
VPGTITDRHVRVVARGIFAIIPEARRRWRWQDDHGRRNIWIGIGIYGCGIEIPDAASDPPPSEASVMPTVMPISMPPDIEVVMPKSVNVMIAVTPAVATSGDGEDGESQHQ